MRTRIGRPSPSLVIAMLALCLAIGGTAIAVPGAADKKPISKKTVKKIAAKQIKKKAPGLHVASADQATNADHATNADTATNATNATNAENVDGMSAAKFSVQSLDPVTDAPVISRGGLALTYNCTGGGVNVDATARTDADNARITASVIGEGGPPQVAFNVDEDFDSTDTFDATPTGIDEVQGHLTYHAANGTVVTAVFRTSQGGAEGCIVEGTLLYG